MNQLVPYSHTKSIMLKKPVAYITLDEHYSIKRACDNVFEKSKHSENDKWTHDRDTLLLQMLWTTGARITDVLAMSTEKIDFTAHAIRFLVRKRKAEGGGEFWHEVTLDMETLTELMSYIQTWTIKGLLFPSHRNSKKQLTRNAVGKKVKFLAEEAGIIKNIHPHLWRHGIAMHLQGQGMPIELISYHLAHSGTEITLKTYARLDAKQERKIFENMGYRLR